MAMNVEAEIRDLKRRVGKLEHSFGLLSQQIKAIHKDLLTFQARTEQRFDKIEGRLNHIDGRSGKADGRLDRIESEIRRLREDMPGIVASAMREVLRERRHKSSQDAVVSKGVDRRGLMSRSRFAQLALCTALFGAIMPSGARAQGREDKPFDLKPFIPPVIVLPPNAQVGPGTTSQTTLPTDRASPIYNPQAQEPSGAGVSIKIPNPFRER
jgi:hypothetical protein